jgi:hypothetical protein
MRKRKVVIHIGMGRCGSSSLQFALANRREVLSQIEISYPVGLHTDPAHHALAPLKSAAINAALREWEAVLRKFEAGSADILVLSSENFVAIPNELLKQIANLLADFEVTIVFIGKPQWHLLPSIYRQWLKVGITFKDFAGFYAATREEFHFDQIVMRWAESFGANQVRCDILVGDANAITAFTKLIGHEGLKQCLSLESGRRLNVSINASLLAILPAVDRCFGHKVYASGFPGWEHVEPVHRGNYSRTRQGLVSVMERITEYLPHSGRFLSPAMESDICKYYQTSNKAFHEAFLMGRAPDWFACNREQKS